MRQSDRQTRSHAAPIAAMRKRTTASIPKPTLIKLPIRAKRPMPSEARSVEGREDRTLHIGFDVTALGIHEEIGEAEHRAERNKTREQHDQ